MFISRDLIASQRSISGFVSEIIIKIMSGLGHIVFVVNSRARYTANPGMEHWDALKSLLMWIAKCVAGNQVLPSPHCLAPLAAFHVAISGRVTALARIAAPAPRGEGDAAQSARTEQSQCRRQS